MDMLFAGLPLWTLIVVACATVPFGVRAWIDAELRRAKVKTRAMLHALDPQFTGNDDEGGPARAAQLGGADLTAQEAHDVRESRADRSGPAQPPEMLDGWKKSLS
ncbi:MAG: hypothetical protein NVSMB1_18820 [Polyangiales bacterium]